MKKVISLLLLLFTFSQLGYSQSDVYEELKRTYDQLREESKEDSALVVAKKMNAWALQVETDSSLRYAVSLRYVGSRFYSLSLNDSALYYWNKSLEVLEKQQRAESLDAAYCLYNLGIFYYLDITLTPFGGGFTLPLPPPLDLFSNCLWSSDGVSVYK